MTRRRVLILAAAVALLLLAVDVRSLFAAHSLHRLVAWLWALCSRLTEPLPMALVTLGAALAKNGVPFEMHIFPHGQHGLGLAPEMPDVAQWAGLCQRWLRGLGYAE